MQAQVINEENDDLVIKRMGFFKFYFMPCLRQAERDRWSMNRYRYHDNRLVHGIKSPNRIMRRFVNVNYISDTLFIILSLLFRIKKIAAIEVELEMDSEMKMKK